MNIGLMSLPIYHWLFHAAWFFFPLENITAAPLVPQLSNRWTLISKNWMNRRGPCPTSGCWVLASPCISPVFEGRWLSQTTDMCKVIKTREYQTAKMQGETWTPLSTRNLKPMKYLPSTNFWSSKCEFQEDTSLVQNFGNGRVKMLFVLYFGL